MKRFFLTFLIILCVFTLCACGRTPTLNTELPSTAEVSCQDITYTVSIGQTEDGDVITLLSPDTVSGISYRRFGDTMTIEYEGLKCVTDNTYLPEDAPAASLLTAITALEGAQYENSEDTDDLFSSCDGRFMIKASDGQIREICDEKFGYIFTFQ